MLVMVVAIFNVDHGDDHDDEKHDDDDDKDDDYDDDDNNDDDDDGVTFDSAESDCLRGHVTT